MTNPDAILADPAWFPEAIDTGRDIIRFAHVTRDGLAKTAFLDQRMAPIVTGRTDLRLSEAMKVWKSDKSRKPRMAAFLFHSAFCCSTLLARALDAPGTCLALKEPDILMQLANALRVDEGLKRNPEAAQSLCEFVFGLLARPFAKGERVLVKPTNSANNLIGAVRKAGAPALILYGDLRSFLVSVIKKGEAYDPETRGQDEAAIEASHREMLDLIAPWANSLTLKREISLPLPRALGA